MTVLDDILKGISPVMGAYREAAWKEVRELRQAITALEQERELLQVTIDDLEDTRDELITDLADCKGVMGAIIRKESLFHRTVYDSGGLQQKQCFICGNIRKMNIINCTNSDCTSVQARKLLEME